MHPNFTDDLKSRPFSFYALIALSGLTAYSIYKIQPNAIGISASAISSSLIQHYAFSYMKNESTTDPLTPDSIEEPTVDKFASFF